jgi:ATP/maltotriose-dependent transcriptional regulator MalT/two-component SAPR family response regulator
MLPIPVSKTKIIPPRRRDELLARKRLLDMLFDALDRKLALVSAPAGYGKTSLLIDLVRQSEYKCCWLSLDELDREPQRFISYLLASMAEQFPGFGHQTAAVLNGLPSIENEMERLAVMLVNEAYGMIHEHFVLIFDDFHILENEKPIHDFLNRFIQLADDNCHILIASRTLTTLHDLPLMVAREQVSGLSFSDLAFRSEEIQALILQNNKIYISDEEAGKLIEESEGWITGLQFSGINLARKDVNQSVLNTGVGLFDYLGQQVLDRQKPIIREFLLRTSLMEEFDAQLCEAVLSPFYEARQDWDDFIKAIVQNNLFALPVGADGRSLRYHHLFRDYLRTRFEKERKEEVKPVLARLGSAYEAMGEWEKAHYVIKQLGNADALADMVERACVYISQRALSITESWLNELPPSLLRNRPGMLSIRGTIAYIKGDLENGLDLLTKAEKKFRENGDRPNLALTLVRRSTGYRLLGDYASSIRDIDEVIEQVENSDSDQAVFAEALRIKGLTLYRMGKARQAIVLLERSLEIYTNLNDPLSVPILFLETGMIYDALGRYPEAVSAYEKALHIWKRETNLLQQSNLLNNMGFMYHARGEYEKAAFAYEDGLLCAKRSGQIRSEALISIGLGDLYAELQDFEIAEQNYRHAEELIAGLEDHFLLFSLNHGRFSLALLQNNLHRARDLIEAMKVLIGVRRSNYENGYLHLAEGKLLLYEARSRKAVEELTRSEALFREDGREAECSMVRVWLSAAYTTLQDYENAIKNIKNLAGNRGEVPHVVIVSIAQTRKWLEPLQDDNESKRLTLDLFSKSERFTSKMPSIRRELHRHAREIQIPSPRLIIKAFGNSTVEIGGVELSLSDWQTQSVRDLFFFLLNSKKPLTKEQIAEVLWPELDEPSKIKLRFKNELYRLRRAVGQETVRFVGASYFFDHSLDYEYDVEAFESYFLRAKSAKSLEEQTEFYRKAVDLVRGPYLNDVFYDWVSADRDRLGQMYLNALLTLADLYLRTSNLHEALSMSKAAIDYDPTLEAGYRISMLAYQRMGDRQSVFRTYQACLDMLRQLLSLPPSKETEELYKKLIA